MKKLVTVMTMALVTIGLATAALAKDGDRFAQGRKAIEDSGIKVTSTAEEKDFNGKGTALVMRTGLSPKELVGQFLDLHRTGKRIGGSQVAGIAHVTQSDTYNVTLRDGDKVTIVKIAKDKNGSRMFVRESRNRPIGKGK